MFGNFVRRRSNFTIVAHQYTIQDGQVDGAGQSTAPNRSETTPAVAAPARAWAASFSSSFQGIYYAFRENTRATNAAFHQDL
jgi:hypothetical protein